MSRRDTILVAVLINAGLLIVLFASALKSNVEREELVRAPQATPVQAVAVQPKPLILDEVEQALTQAYHPPVEKSEPVVAVVPAPAETPATPFIEEFKFQPVPEAQPPVAAVPAPPKEATEHRVKKGDVLEKIARTYHCSVDELMKVNQLHTTNLRIGQVLKIPSTSVAAAASSPVPARQEDSHKYYIVKNGDNPWTIAVKNHLKVEELLKLNDLNEDKARRLKPGDKLRIQ